MSFGYMEYIIVISKRLHALINVE